MSSYLSLLIRFHLEEWATGKHIQGQFKETEDAAIYRGILKDINKWVGDNDATWKNIRAKWYKRALYVRVHALTTMKLNITDAFSGYLSSRAGASVISKKSERSDPDISDIFRYVQIRDLIQSDPSDAQTSDIHFGLFRHSRFRHSTRNNFSHT